MAGVKMKLGRLWPLADASKKLEMAGGANDDTLDNLITLCVTCHQMQHHFPTITRNVSNGDSKSANSWPDAGIGNNRAGPRTWTKD